MVKSSQVLTFNLTATEVEFCNKMAGAACLGGRSSVRGEDRQSMLTEDQLVGQLGTYTGLKWMTGHSQLYCLSRWYQNKMPYQGDGGSDVPGANIDFKSSMIRTGRPLLEHRLAVRPTERHPGWVYVLCLVNEHYQVFMIGWATDEELPVEPEKEGGFEGAFCLPAKELHPLPPFRFKWT